MDRLRSRVQIAAESKLHAFEEAAELIPPNVGVASHSAETEHDPTVLLAVLEAVEAVEPAAARVFLEALSRSRALGGVPADLLAEEDR